MQWATTETSKRKNKPPEYTTIFINLKNAKEARHQRVLTVCFPGYGDGRQAIFMDEHRCRDTVAHTGGSLNCGGGWEGIYFNGEAVRGSMHLSKLVRLCINICTCQWKIKSNPTKQWGNLPLPPPTCLPNGVASHRVLSNRNTAGTAENN